MKISIHRSNGSRSGVPRSIINLIRSLRASILYCNCLTFSLHACLAVKYIFNLCLYMQYKKMRDKQINGKTIETNDIQIFT